MGARLDGKGNVVERIEVVMNRQEEYLQSRCLRDIERHQGADQSYLEEDVRLIRPTFEGSTIPSLGKCARIVSAT